MNNGIRKLKTRFGRLAAIVVFAVTSITWACGPNFYAWLITSGKSAMLYAPFANFSREVSPLTEDRQSASRHLDSGTTNDRRAVDAELPELDAALRQTETTEAKRREIVAGYGAVRIAMREQSARLDPWNERQQWDFNKREVRPKFYPVATPAGLPEEFQLYLDGASAFFARELEAAVVAWETLLKLPEPARQYRSTWAAFMLGKVHLDEKPDEARQYFQLTRELARKGFKDGQGLAAASFGWEARLALNEKNYAGAIHRYLDHHATGETNTSIESLRITASAACKAGVDVLRPLVRDAETRQVITAYLLSRVPHIKWYDPETLDTRALNWLEAIEQEKVNDVEMAERIALIAYQSGELMVAGRWLKRAKDDTLLTLWLRAKLLMWDGELDDAAKVYDRIIALHASVLEDPIRYKSGEWFDALRTRFDYHEFNPASRTLAAEAGLVRFHRHEFAAALDVLARAGFWMDAAYLGERILTLEELKNYVDENWPAKGEHAAANRNSEAWGPHAKLDGIREQLRHLLARRLARAERYTEAKSYFPADLAADFNSFIGALQTSHSKSLPLSNRKESLVRAARLLRQKGMEFIGTEMEPDGAWASGHFGEGITFTNRIHLKAGAFLAPSDAEAERYVRHGPRLNEQFHYRYLAADLAWEASLLMENNTLELARWYCEVGGWLKNRDPKEADRFYKALAQRCRKTDIGAAADKIRWFPKLDKEGNWAAPENPPK